MAQDRAAGRPRAQARGAPAARQPYTFFLDPTVVEHARREVGELGMVRSIETALAAAVDYHLWVREVTRGERDVLS